MRHPLLKRPFRRRFRDGWSGTVRYGACNAGLSRYGDVRCRFGGVYSKAKIRRACLAAGASLYTLAMCGRYNLVTDARALIDFFEIERSLFDVDEFSPRYNIAPSQDVPIVRNTGDGRELLLARWGLVPHWSKEPKSSYSTINARAETVAEKPTYRNAFKSQRCLIPATGFYEWQNTDGQKWPHHISLPEKQLFAFAGLWDHWEREGTAFDSCSIIVTAANATMKTLHDRMPVIINAAQYGTWLNAQKFNRAQLLSLLTPYGGTLQIEAVSRYVNSPRNDGPACIEGVIG